MNSQCMVGLNLYAEAGSVHIATSRLRELRRRLLPALSRVALLARDGAEHQSQDPGSSADSLPVGCTALQPCFYCIIGLLRNAVHWAWLLAIPSFNHRLANTKSCCRYDMGLRLQQPPVQKEPVLEESGSLGLVEQVCLLENWLDPVLYFLGDRCLSVERLLRCPASLCLMVCKGQCLKPHRLVKVRRHRELGNTGVCVCVAGGDLNWLKSSSVINHS